MYPHSMMNQLYPSTGQYERKFFFVCWCTSYIPCWTIGLLFFLIPQSHCQTDTKPTSNRPKSLNSGRDRFAVGLGSVLSVWDWYVFGQSKLSGRDLSNMFERSRPDKMSVACRLCVGVESVLSGSVPGHVGESSATDATWFVGIKSVQLCIGHLSADLTPTLDQIKSDITTNCEESADTFPNQDRHVPNTPRTQTECNPTTVCDIKLHIKDVKMPYSPVAGQILWSWHQKVPITHRDSNGKIPILTSSPISNMHQLNQLLIHALGN